jgi:hypothetical protein
MRKKINIILIILLIFSLSIINISAVPIGAKIEDLFDSTLATDHSYSGLTLTLTAGESVVFGDVVYMNWTDKEVKKTQADASTTVPAIGIALETKADGAACLVLIFGYIRDDSWDFTTTEVYVSDTTAGGVLSTAPSDAGDQVQRLGFAFHADKMFFNPSIDVGEI